MKKLIYSLVAAVFFATSAHAAFIDLEDGTVWDDTTGLMWQKDHGTQTTNEFVNPDFFVWGDDDECDGTATNENDALCYCSSLSLGPTGGEYTDWRVSDRHEFMNTVDYSQPTILLDPLFTTGALPQHVFWTSTTVPDDPDQLPVADTARAFVFGTLGEGLIRTNAKTGTLHVRCVRGRVFQVVVATPGANLSVSDADTGENWVDYGASQDVTYTSTTGLVNVTVDGVSTGAKASPYTQSFSNVTTNHAISAEAATGDYTLALSVGENGTVIDVDESQNYMAPGGNLQVLDGTQKTFQVAPAAGYTIDTVTYDGVDITLDGTSSYTTPAISEDGHTFAATFIEATVNYTVTVSIGENGTVTDVGANQILSPPGGDVLAGDGTQKTFEVTPAAGYSIDTVTFDGVEASLDNNNRYTTVAIGENGHIFAVTYVEGPVTSTSNLLLTIPAIISGAKQ